MRLLALALLCGTTAAHAETAIQLAPEEIEYTAETTADASGMVCKISLAVFSPNRPETLNFNALVYVAATPTPQGLWGSTGYGYTLDVGEIAYQNGLPSGVTKKRISDSVFTSPSFSSSGRMFPTAMPDGGLAAYTKDGATGKALIDAVLLGSFAISFHEAGIEGYRTYSVRKAMSSNEAQKFVACLKTLSESFAH
jgi:hypothetical protein